MSEFVFEKISDKGNKRSYEIGNKGRDDCVSERSVDYCAEYQGKR
jgi:hypothetical protein